jgi:hypothetical protein
MNNKVIRGILAGSVGAIGLALVLVLTQIVLYYRGAPETSVQSAASRPPAARTPAPAPPAEPAAEPEAAAPE